AFQVISERYDYRRSTCITTNRPFKDWPKVFPDALNAQVIAERLTERAEHFVFDGKGYRPTKHLPGLPPPSPGRSFPAAAAARSSSGARLCPTRADGQGEEPSLRQRVGPWLPVKPLEVGPSVTVGDSRGHPGSGQCVNGARVANERQPRGRCTVG